MPLGHEPELRDSLVPLHRRVACTCGKWSSDYIHRGDNAALKDWHEHWANVSATSPKPHQIRLRDALILPGVHCACEPCAKTEGGSLDLGYFSKEDQARAAWKGHAG